MCTPHIILIVDFGPSIKKPLHYLCLSLQSSYSQWHREGRSLRGCIGRGKEVCEGSSHHYTHTSLPTVVARLGSALLFSKMSTICVWPYSLATYTELNPSYRQNSTHIRTCIYSGVHACPPCHTLYTSTIHYVHRYERTVQGTASVQVCCMLVV